jgi:ribosome-binding protein aMBF1 (putative translation factor)
MSTMNSINKARKYKSPLIDELLKEVTPLEMKQAKLKMQVASKIEDLIKSKSWSKSEFAEKVGKHPSEVTKWLSGTQNFTIDTLIEIAFVFKIKLSDLFIS